MGGDPSDPQRVTVRTFGARSIADRGVGGSVPAPARRMARDPQVSLTDVQWVLGHARLTTTQIYLTPSEDEVIATVRAHHARRAEPRPPVPPVPAPGYRPESLDVLFGRP